MNHPSGYLRLTEASERARMSARHLRRAIYARELRAYRPTGRLLLIREEDLEQWLTAKPAMAELATGEATAVG